MTLLRPILQNKFRVLFKDFGWQGATTTILTQQLRKISLPNIQAENGVRPGLHMEFRDEVTNCVMKLLLTQISRQRDDANNARFQTDIELIDDAQKTIRSYVFSECLLGGILHDSLSYEDREALDISTLANYQKFEIFDANHNKLW